MRYVQAQFSLKYEPQPKIRRNVNAIEDLLQEYYGVPQVIAIPDEISPEIPRIRLNSKHGHSQINFSQLAVDFIVKFDGEYSDNYEATKIYINERIVWLKAILKEIGIDNYYFFGLTYNNHLDIDNQNPVEFIKTLLGGNLINNQNIYEVLQKVASIEDDKFFVNQQISTFKEFQTNLNTNPNLLDFGNSKLISEGVNVSIDINNRYAYMCNGKLSLLDDFNQDFNRIVSLMEYNIKKYR